jgi:FlaA1/EpsC-like NDP-sugar epimerase
VRSSLYANKRVLVTGACGTIGREIVRQLLEHEGVGELVGLDNNESELFFLEQRFSAWGNARFFLADIRDCKKLCRMFRGVNLVFHAAAFKHVIMCERSPYEAVQTNIMGVQNVILAAAENHVQRVIFTSSDKAVNPTNVMGTSKLMGERLMSAAAGNMPGTVFASTRFGNVLGSRGSVIPIFREQIRRGGPVTLTHSDMTRFVMSTAQAVNLVIRSADLARGGEVFVPKMRAMCIADLASVMLRKLARDYGRDPLKVEIKVIGIKPGEKLYEELMNHEETRRTVELDDYYAILPAYRGGGSFVDDFAYPGQKGPYQGPAYTSENVTPLTQEQISRLLEENGLFAKEGTEEAHPAERYWPDGPRVARQAEKKTP